MTLNPACCGRYKYVASEALNSLALENTKEVLEYLGFCLGKQPGGELRGGGACESVCRQGAWDHLGHPSVCLVTQLEWARGCVPGRSEGRGVKCCDGRPGVL